MVDYTTVRIKKSSLEKINKLKGADGSVSDVIEKLLETVDGCNIDDVIEVKRDSIAINLEYSVIDDGTFEIVNEYGITFHELRLGKVGDKFTANPNPSADKYLLEEAQILFVDDVSVLVRVTEILKSDNGVSSVIHLEHIDLF